MSQTFSQLKTYPQAGQTVRIVKLETTKGMLVHERYLNVRGLGEGVAKSFVPGHGGDVWFVTHTDGTVGAYSITELSPT